MTSEPDKKPPIWRRYFLWGMPVAGIAAAFAAGIIFWGGFNTAMEATNTKEFCVSCHEMRDFVYEEYTGTIHDVNRSGVGAVCSDCHVPKDWTHKMIRKIKASRELYGKMVGSINTREKFEAKRVHLAMNEWERMKATDSRECRNCHDFESMMPEFQKPRARQQHLNAMTVGQTCIDCHKGIAHSDARDRADEEYLEELEAPNPAFIREIPAEYLASLEKIEAQEAAEAEAEKAAKKVQQEAVQAQIAAAVDAAVAEERAKAAGEEAATPSGGGGDVATNIDWNAVASADLKLFYPGQASFEWVQNGKFHGGARPLTKGGDQCTTCHAKELDTIGNKIVAGGELEPTPIPGKRGVIDATVQAAHDDENLYIRLQWPDAGHNPAPFVDGGKMDPDNQIKVAMMITGTGIELGEQVGCWASCHADNSYMPFDPGAEAIAANGDVAGRLNTQDTVTKYISESRTDVEIKGRRGKALGGWDKLQAAEQIEQYLADGTYLDLMRVYADGSATNGYLLEQRVVNDGEIAASAELSGGMWTVVFTRPLNSGAPGDVPLEAGQTYTVGFAIHDDFSAARFHHVTLNTSLALDDDSAFINVVKQ
ncbi:MULTISPECIES: NapC/NirT family cytochrome c [unclassified Ruegeria]|uniref:NapC/NirT family cytochrome c n=1 Tax=unclassified Ruegeria TaxID=2625375 RepID=UPI0014887DA3|nr:MULTISPECIES: NapC/NirT family cytochrome c [unclassified Ruegeria]NOD76918.1 cytochrome C552 [Ruegeria sp. HKCCD4332]NOD88441.1 cytochrome C552 [Ruegeria sp. HKCCD4318]NOE13350.1 cytochrome C552 [Ruegeria sp. HKCCD4318-2]NOG11108.1 cytochrome C552 [Ruegeria sp. HKCCD4315]